MSPQPITILLDPETSEVLRDLGPIQSITCQPSSENPQRMELVVTTATK